MSNNTCMYKSIRVLFFFLEKGVYKSVGCVSYCAEECKLSCVYIAILTTVGPVLIARI